ncbi:SgcJ/EcaC family oxidoreductase [Jeotgalibacillus sp. ET6]|uniref:SgcJ/EcaC family oxidoreductase n=1 Tax=Jeotgalibacillus sp. ET6 TaxID=3037260 RepID=UPI002418579B|nr:SgcJ/EcaC family oxidoreductase [Jeotgalibacillus sp. ET6]MDG5471296.1 SgcJ/EcaC family oxidoreductase [Jeotgalibacillus sp. ET6]
MNNQTIENVIKSLMNAWDAKNPKAFAEVFTKDAIFTNVLGDVAEGKEAIEQMHIFPFSGPLKDAHQTYVVTHIKWLSSDSAIADLRWEGFNQKIPGTDQVLPPRKGLINLAITFEDGKWKIAAGYNTDYTATYQRKGEKEEEVLTNYRPE